MRANQLNFKESIWRTVKLNSDNDIFESEKSSTPLISVIIPIFNEEKTIRNVIERIPNHQRYEIILVDDGSTDNSLKKILEINNREIKIIKHENNQGYGAAVLSGFKHAAGDIIVTMDSDGQHNPEEISALIKPIFSDKADITVGSRYLGNANYKIPLYIRIGEYFVRICLRSLYRQRVYNNQSGFRAFNYSSLNIFKKMKQTTFGFCTETLFEAAYNRLRISEVPVNMNGRKYGNSNINLFKVLISISSCVLNYLLKRFKLTRFFSNRIIMHLPLLEQDSLNNQNILDGHFYKRNIHDNIISLKDNYIYPNLKIGIVIPAFNEELNLDKVLSKIPKNLSNKLELIVVDDGSTDNTQGIALTHKSIVLCHNKNKGYGAAVKTGLKYCKNKKYDITIILDGDGQHNPKCLSQFIDSIILENFDFAIGNRYYFPYKMKVSKKLCSKIISAIYLIFFSKRIHDPTNGYRALSYKTLKDLNLESNYSISQEMLLKLVPEYSFKEIPVKIDQRKNGHSFVKLRQYFIKMFLIVLKYYVFPKVRKISRKIFSEETRKIVGVHILKT